MSILALISCVWIICNFCVLFKRKVEEVIPVGFMALILCLQVLAMLKKLSYIGPILLIICFVWVLSNFLKKKLKSILTEFPNYILTFGCAVFVCLVVICVFLEYGRKVIFFDEFNFWATAVKSLWEHNGFASAIEMWSIWEYPQGMPLLEWFGIYLLGNYQEWIFYAIRLIFDFSFLLPIFKNLKIKWYWSVIAAVMLFIFPSIVNATSYQVLSVDGDLGFLFGFYMYSIIDRKKIDLFYYVRIILTSCVIILTKSFSILFVIYGLLLFVILAIYDSKVSTPKNCLLKRTYNNILKAGVFICPIVVLEGWTWYLQLVGNASTRVQKRATGFLSSFLAGEWQWSGYEADLIKAFLKSFVTQPVSYVLGVNSKFGVGVLTPILVVVLISALIFIFYKMKYISKVQGIIYQLYWLFVVASYSCVFILAHCTLFLGEIQKYSKMNYMGVTLGRYCAPVYLGGIIATTLCLFQLAGKIEEKRINYFQKLVLIGVVSISIIGSNYFAISKAIRKDERRLLELEQMEQNISDNFGWLNLLKPGKEKVYYLSQKYLDVYYIYKFVPYVVQQPSIYYPIYGIGDIQNYLYDNQFHYIYYADDSMPAYFIDYINPMLPEYERLEIGGLYEINMDSTRFTLTRVN